MHWHIDTDIVSLIVIVAIYIYDLKLTPQSGSELRNRRFRRCLQVGIGVTVIDVAASIVMEFPTTPLVYHLFMTAYFVCIELIIVEWFLYVLTILYQDNERGRRTISHVVLCVYAAYAIFNLLNPWTGLVYTLGAGMEYSRGPFFGVMLMLYGLYALALFLLILIRWRRIPGEFPGGVLLMTPVIVAIAIVMQLCFPGLLLIMPAYMICFLLAFLFLQNMRMRSSQKLMDDLTKVAKTDQLTGLYNRSGMEAMVKSTLKDCYGLGVVVLIVDIDDLKTINDTMGHSEGDRSIKLVAAKMKEHFRTGDTVVRYGGDEFLAFFCGNFDEPQISRSLQRLIAELDKLRIGANDDIPLHGSAGAAYGVVGVDAFETLCNRADTALYHPEMEGDKPECGVQA